MDGSGRSRGREPAGRRAARRFVPHALLLLIAAAELIAGLAARPDDGELRRLAAEGTPREKVGAFFLLTNRDEPPPLPAAELERILREEPPLLREWTMTSNFTRFGHDRLLRTYIQSTAGTPHGERCRFWNDHRVGRYGWITLRDLDGHLRSGEGER